MLALAINHPRTRSVTTHSSREVARAELARFLNDATAHRPGPRGVGRVCAR